MLATASKEYAQQQRLAALAVIEAERVATRGAVAVAQSIQTYQAAAVALSLQALSGLLAEQGIAAAQEAVTVPASLLTGAQALSGMVTAASSPGSLGQLVQTMVQDAYRTARATDIATRPAVTGHVRFLRLPSCKRCVPLAGRVYRYSEGFQRHPRCDCGMTPTNKAVGRDLVTDPLDAFNRGMVKDLTKAEATAISEGADFGQVVNIGRKQAGLVIGSSVMERAGRLTPQGCLALGTDRADALRLLKQFGYITT